MFRAAEMGDRGQIAPGPQAPRGLITLNASRSGGPRKVDQQYFPKLDLIFSLGIFANCP